MDTKKIKKWFYGIILIIAFFGFFIWQQSVNLGVLPLVSVTCIWACLFYKVTGIDFGLFTDEPKQNKD